MSTTVCDITVQFSFFLFMRLNIVIDKICDSLIVILSSSLNLENGMKEHVQNVALKINMDLSNFLFLFLLLLFFFTWFRIGFCLWLTLLQPIYSKLESRFIVKSEAPVFFDQASLLVQDYKWSLSPPTFWLFLLTSFEPTSFQNSISKVAISQLHASTPGIYM